MHSDAVFSHHYLCGTTRRFITYNVIGGALWVALFVFSGYLIGNIPIIKDNFSIVTVLIILISVTPVLIELVRGRHVAAVPGQA